jgi:hypothetical protein
MRPLIIDDAARAEAARVLAYAKANPYRTGDPVPGDDPRFVAYFGTYRAVFTYTHSDGLIFRHLTISVPSDKYPNVIAAFAIADLFGFTGHAESWSIDVNKAEHCVVVVQPVAANVPRKDMQ